MGERQRIFLCSGTAPGSGAPREKVEEGSNLINSEKNWAKQKELSRERVPARTLAKFATQPRLSCIRYYRCGGVFPHSPPNLSNVTKVRREDCLSEWGSNIMVLVLRLATRGLGCMTSLASYHTRAQIKYSYNDSPSLTVTLVPCQPLLTITATTTAPYSCNFFSALLLPQSYLAE